MAHMKTIALIYLLAIGMIKTAYLRVGDFTSKFIRRVKMQWNMVTGFAMTGMNN